MENQPTAPMIAKPGAFPAKVAKVIDDYKLVINRGKEHGIREGQRVLIYKVDDEQIVDPDTGESLGSLELVKGTGKVFQVEDKYSLVESFNPDVSKIMQEIESLENRNNNLMTIGGVKRSAFREIEGPVARQLRLKNYREIAESVQFKKLIPFDNPQVGDTVKPI
ncbi:MAG: hypothetical protein VKL20_02435 [Synechocystis sp.]|nr:hypothetical protein [Synechocystis sp.]